MGRDYYLGLDMGTSSVGWAVTDEKYNLLRAKGKDLWGIREFEEAEGGIARRQNRISRRRRQREQVRIGLLKSYFAEEIEKVDPDFLQRLENSKYHLSDKDEKVRYKSAIFNDPEYTDKDYYRDYPTIFHLRAELIHNQEPHDIRLVYLALLNMFKHRGHFLNASLSAEEETQSMSDAYTAFRALVEEVMTANETENLFFPDVKADEIEAIISSRDYNRKRKSELMTEMLGFTKKDKAAQALIKGMCGLTVDVKTVFREIESEAKLSISFSDSNYDEKIVEIQEVLDDEQLELLEAVKTIYDIGSLAGVLKGEKYLSDARITDYNKHKEDLALLKKIIRKYTDQKTYNDLFRGTEPGSYSAYVNSTNSGKKQRRNMGGNAKRNQEAFYASLKKLLNKLPSEDDDVQKILADIDKELFLPKQLTFANGVIPNQVHAREMKAILNNAEQYLPFLTEKDESGLTVSERILKLFSFQIPYYVGPVTTKSSRDGGNGWVVRKESGQVLPWNIEDKIDMDATSKKFIENLIRECTYIAGEKVLPKGSLLYERYCVLNEINNIKIDGRPIDVELKQKIFEDKFMSGKKVTRKQLVTYLHGKGVLEDDAQLTGIDKTINNSLSSYGKFLGVFGDELKKDSCQIMVEDIIRDCTIYGDSKKRLRETLQKKYVDNNNLSESQLKRILGFKFKDWGRMSKEFLEMQGINRETGEVMSLVQAMWETNLNLMELIYSEDFTFAEALQEKQAKDYLTLSEFKFEDLDEYYFSAPVKRMVWQTLLIIKELEKVLGAPPKKVFIEMTRSDGVKGDRGRTISRKKQFEDLYKKIKDESQDWASIIDNADASGKLRSKKMYLYLTQMGKCMYTGKPIDLDDLFDDNKYDIDHIYPRHYVKDDNLGNNLVLVEKKANASKGDRYPLDTDIRGKMHGTWKFLKEKGLITEEKYRRLTGSNPFSEEQQADFIARQLVQTSQGTKGVADLLKQLLPDAKIAYSKASNVSDFRRDYDLPKSRLINDFHHANDAYLNIVVGNAYLVKFTQNPLNYIRSGDVQYNLGRMFEKDIVRNGEVAWLADDGKGNHGTIVTVKKVMARNTPMMTRMVLNGHGAIANATLYPASKASADNYIPLKGSDSKIADVTKYGGFTSVSTSRFVLVEHLVKKERIRTLEALPILVANSCKTMEDIENYCEEELGLIAPKVKLDGIKIQSLLKINGFYVHLSGKTNKQLALRNAVNLCLDAKWKEYIHYLEKASNNGNYGNPICSDMNIELYSILAEKHSSSIFAKRPNPVGTKLVKEKETFSKLELVDQVSVLLQILQLSAIGITQADLRAIGGAGIAGKMLISKDISKQEEALLIMQSPTGLYESTIDLKTI